MAAIIGAASRSVPKKDIRFGIMAEEGLANRMISGEGAMHYSVSFSDANVFTFEAETDSNRKNPYHSFVMRGIL